MKINNLYAAANKEDELDRNMEERGKIDDKCRRKAFGGPTGAGLGNPGPGCEISCSLLQMVG